MEKAVKKTGRPPKKSADKRSIMKHIALTEAEQRVLDRKTRLLKKSESAIMRLPLSGEDLEHAILWRILEEIGSVLKAMKAFSPDSLDREAITFELKKAAAIIINRYADKG